MRSEQEIRELMEKLSKISGFVSKFGTLKQFYNQDVQFAYNASFVLSWVLCEITSVRFTSDYVNFTNLEEIALLIERRTGNKFERGQL